MSVSSLSLVKKTYGENEHEQWEYTVPPYDDLNRRDARSLVFHLLYAAEAFDYEESLSALVDNFNRGFNIEIPASSDVVSTVQAIIDGRELLDKTYEPFLANWRPERISIITKLILRFGTWELLHTATDPRIVINESIELTKCFAEEDAYKFVNGILDKVAKNLQPPATT